jgi:hypothetical protein
MNAAKGTAKNDPSYGQDGLRTLEPMLASSGWLWHTGKVSVKAQKHIR